jgi:hypothetical protein
VWFAKIRSPAEVVAHTIRFIGDYQGPKQGVMTLNLEAMYQGQNLLNPPSVEGWHTGKEWIDGGSLVRRINFCADRLSDSTLPGVKDIIDRLSARGNLSPGEVVDGCLELLGGIRVGGETRRELVEHARVAGGGRHTRREEITQVLQLIGAAKEYQFG